MAVTRVAMISIIVEDEMLTDQINETIGCYRDFVIGRMGIPKVERGVNVISLVMKAPQDQISALSGKLGMLKGVNTKTVYSNVYGEMIR